MTTLCNKVIVYAIVIFVLGLNMIPTIGGDEPVFGTTIYVDDDADPSWYNANHVRTIQEGITNATEGDLVFVYKWYLL